MWQGKWLLPKLGIPKEAFDPVSAFFIKTVVAFCLFTGLSPQPSPLSCGLCSCAFDLGGAASLGRRGSGKLELLPGDLFLAWGRSWARLQEQLSISQ